MFEKPRNPVGDGGHDYLREAEDVEFAWSEEEVETRDDGNYAARDETLPGLLREASHALEGRPALEIASYGVSPKPIPADDGPVFGALDEIAGYHVALSNRDATLGLIAGKMPAREIPIAEAHPLPADFCPAASRRPDPPRSATAVLRHLVGNGFRVGLQRVRCVKMDRVCVSASHLGELAWTTTSSAGSHLPFRPKG